MYLKRCSSYVTNIERSEICMHANGLDDKKIFARRNKLTSGSVPGRI